jgi:hypothetical protein
MTILLPIQDPLPPRPVQKSTNVGYISPHLGTEVRTPRSLRFVIFLSLHLHDQNVKERHDWNVLDQPGVLREDPRNP